MNKNEFFPLSYCSGRSETLARLGTLYEHRSREQICAIFDVPTEEMRRFRDGHEDGFQDYPNPVERITFWDAHLAERKAVEDDSVPTVYLSEMDQGLYGGLLGGDVRFLCDTQTAWISSMVSPLFDRIEDATGLKLDREHPWWRRYIEQLDVFTAAAAGKFGISHYILVDSLNLIFECIGATKTYLALMDAPNRVAKLIEFAYDFNVAIHEEFFKRVGLLAGGTCSNMIGWCAGRVVSESVDPFHMMSVDDFEKWGRGPVQRIFDHFDGGCLHIHANGRHLLEPVTSIRDLKAIYLGDDVGFPPAFEVLDELKARVGNVPVVVRVKQNEFAAALDAHTLVGGVLYRITNSPDADTANRTMDRVREYVT